MNVAHDGVARILCVIEDHATRTIVTRFLRDYDMSVTSASNRLEVLRHVHQNKPDLIILDLRRDRVEGLNLLHKILPSSIPVIITDDDRVVALEVGADDYITEPTTPRVSSRHASARYSDGAGKHRSQLRAVPVGQATGSAA
jgi:two-component system OmpR family response regulator